MSDSRGSGGRRNGSGAVMIVVGALAFAPGAVAAATAPIYKCMDAHLGLVYTDQRCADGKQIDIHPGHADPLAAELLEHARDQIERRAAARVAEDRRVAAQKDYAVRARRERQEASEAVLGAADNEAPTWSPAYLPVVVPVRTRHHHPHRTATKRSFLPHDPLLGPRS
ncbi:MAG: hypothetical protein M3023_05340 [Pseudomonadota bacterium]|nr:hypothetical protein [Pseudomonadota bacterium]